ncbi:DUF2714 domain-containing protein [Mycoplasma bovis]|uniref:DUF2714 domain-containing protein n=1 Tax=Mycoplasmopsis bovis (strain ATCC 25523 / DSM 22781 / NCTC 10131 / PG45) TaxID=289397 RepID=A0A454AQP6_MYCBG|nr:DUF2714 domain-containing protein [Mycoplasmopsis bovis]ADR25391.1 conserved hypothetical protein [Mycoplasmopsis bovis PG45]MBT1315955.1 DUF2714 domain-containing protein [Mycoplasmopsis bovis]MBT1319794.1 DUF2714 domain-containing protein [Mycoplasmopsis bovis]MBT1328221.1 DUF2714 domain-containing protein [Mycoplasmopsis bovis]MBT1332750.1 DUF2714 domain-containing protein [Mycoplasmopsis bovis]
MKKHKLENNSMFNIYNQFEEAKMSADFVDYNKLMAQVLLDCNLGFNSHEYVKFSSNFDEALSKKFDIVLEKFVITFNVNHKFSLDALVPMLKSSEDSNTEAVNFASSQEPKFNNLLKLYNKLINDLVIANNKYVELFPNIIVFRSKNTNSLKILFDASSALFRGE